MTTVIPIGSIQITVHAIRNVTFVHQTKGVLPIIPFVKVIRHHDDNRKEYKITQEGKNGGHSEFHQQFDFPVYVQSPTSDMIYIEIFHRSPNVGIISGTSEYFIGRSNGFLVKDFYNNGVKVNQWLQVLNLRQETVGEVYVEIAYAINNQKILEMEKERAKIRSMRPGFVGYHYFPSMPNVSMIQLHEDVMNWTNSLIHEGLIEVINIQSNSGKQSTFSLTNSSTEKDNVIVYYRRTNKMQGPLSFEPKSEPQNKVQLFSDDSKE